MSLLTWVVVALGVGALTGGVLARRMGREVAGRRHAEREAARAQAVLEPLAHALRHSIEAVIVTDAQRRIVWVNEAFEVITGYPADEAMGRRPAELLQFDGTDPQTILAMRSALDAGRPFVGEVLNLGRRPEPYWLHLQIHPLRDRTGVLTGFVAIEADITQRKLQDVALRESAALLDRTERIAGVGGWGFDVRERRMRCTGHVRRLLGLDEQAPFGVRDGLRRLAREDRRRLWDMVQQSHFRGGPQHAELEVRAPDGRRRWMQVTVEVSFEVRPESGAAAIPQPRITGSLLDVTQRRQLKEDLRRSAELMRGAVEAVDEAFALFDPEDRLVFCTDHYRDLYAQSGEAIVPGATFEQIIRYGAERGQYPAAAGRVDEWVAQRVAVFKQGERTLVQQLCNGRTVRVIDRKMPDGHTVGFRVDITELVKATESAEAADRAKTQFIATISHELRTPLQVITGFSDLGRHFAHDHPQFKPMFDDIHAAGMRMLRLVNELLDISRLDGSVGQISLRRQGLVPLVEAVAHELSQLAAQRQLHIGVQLPAALTADVEAFRFQQVLRNVVANALRFAPAHDEVVIQGFDLGLGGVELTVRDHGPGIPEDELEAVFEPFVQSSRTRDGAGGTGLGLAISRRIMSAHRGRILAEAPEGGGALIRLWLPPPQPDADATPRAPKLLRSSLRPHDPAPALASDTPASRQENPCHAPS